MLTLQLNKVTQVLVLEEGDYREEGSFVTVFMSST
jgi:hypothetical protein